MKQLGLIGFPLSHSFSKKYFSEKFEREQIKGWQYDLFPIENIEKLTDILGGGHFWVGLNVTIPYKEKILPFLDELNPEAAAIGAVNCIKIIDKKRIGFNTDVYGFEQSLLRQLSGKLPSGALIFGTGGASKAVQFVLKKLNIPFRLVSRTGACTYEDLTTDDIFSNKLLINTTPLGMSPNVETCPPLSSDLYAAIGSEHFLYDLVYNPLTTKFLELGKKQGANVQNGLEMLHLQAEKAWEIWNRIEN
ncbi:MAG: hypothetical protein RL757_2980 [Bacteroidota bacterium]|jgi:shikimate dehydrogenase